MSTQSSLLAEQYICALDNLEASNYTQMPNIVDHLTYDDINPDTGVLTIKRLSVYAIQLYRVIRNIAGQEHVTWRNTDNLAELANMSKGQVANCKKELLQKFHQLDGNSLIEIVEQKKTNWDNNGHKVNGIIYHKINVRNVWGYNRAFFILRKIEKAASSPHERAHSASSPHERASQGASSPGERNKKQSSKTPLSKEQHSTAEAVSVCSLEKEEGFVSIDNQTRMFNWLLQIGCDVLGATAIVSNFTQQDLYQASGYVKKMIPKMKEKNKPITNIIGYLRKTIENRWWENVSEM